MQRVLKVLFVALVAKPLTLFLLGLNVRGRNNLPLSGPAVIAANHNSHLDTLVLLSIFPLSKTWKVRPVAAADYFLANPFIAWVAVNVLGIIPLDRSGKTSRERLFAPCHEALDRGDILLIFPEGSRGKPESLSRVRKGIHYLLKDRTETKVVPVVMHGLGRALPKGEALLVPFNCDVAIGDTLPVPTRSDTFTRSLSSAYETLLQHCPTWLSQEQGQKEDSPTVDP